MLIIKNKNNPKSTLKFFETKVWEYVYRIKVKTKVSSIKKLCSKYLFNILNNSRLFNKY